MRDLKFLVKPTELRVGNYVTVKYADERNSRTLQINAKQLSDILDNRGITVESGVVLTEENIKRLRREYFVGHACHRGLEFSFTPPGERQVSNNWWSRDVSDFTRLHLSPSYRHEKKGDDWQKCEEPDFWFVWLCAHGTGSSWFLSLMSIDRWGYPLVYVHQLQNLFFILTGKELTFQKDDNY